MRLLNKPIQPPDRAGKPPDKHVEPPDEAKEPPDKHVKPLADAGAPLIRPLLCAFRFSLLSHLLK